MAEIFTSDFKSCAGCNFWDGARKLDAFKDQIMVDSSYVRGKCLLQGSPRKGWELKAFLFCSKWTKWVSLK